ncbi:MAG: DUF3307 domain-containing protein [Elusimicrobia bacterium]|nr:DUF3307 domain-containing protein [Candidatus Liberimonas magnetica]
MIIFWRLILAHLLTDFTLQTNFIAKWKRETVWGCIAHSLVFMISAGILCYEYLTATWVTIGPNIIIYGWMAILFLTIFHFFEDQWRIWTIQKLDSPDSFPFFLWDQFIHVIFIFVLFPQNGGLFPEKWVLLLILFILTTHFTTIFIYYFEKGIYGQAQIPLGRKYISMTARLVIAMTLLLPGKWALSFIVIFLADEIYHRLTNKQEFTRVNWMIGNLLAVIFGLIARYVYY